MKLTLSFEHNQRRIMRSFDVRKWLSMLVLTTVVLLISSRSIHSVDENIQRVQLVKQGLLAQQSVLYSLQAESELGLDAIVQQLANLEQRLALLTLQQKQLAVTTDAKLVFTQSDSLTQAMTIDTDDALTVQSKLTQLNTKLDQQINQLDALEKILANTNINIEQRITGRPINKGWLSSYYGMRDDPFTAKQTMHKGIDFAAKEGAPVIATAAGVVTWSGERYGYGNLIEIDHGNGLVTRYGHNQTLVANVGEVVTKGQSIALVGNTGRSTGAHVHYEIIKNGTQIDPLPYVYRQ